MNGAGFELKLALCLGALLELINNADIVIATRLQAEHSSCKSRRCKSSWIVSGPVVIPYPLHGCLIEGDFEALWLCPWKLLVVENSKLFVGRKADEFCERTDG